MMTDMSTYFYVRDMSVITALALATSRTIKPFYRRVTLGSDLKLRVVGILSLR